MWEKLHHPRITPLLGYMRSTNDIILGDSPFLVSPFYANGNLQVYLYKNPSADRLALVRFGNVSLSLYTECDVSQLYQAAEGLNYLHTFPGYHIAHLDMKMVSRNLSPIYMHARPSSLTAYDHSRRTSLSQMLTKPRFAISE